MNTYQCNINGEQSFKRGSSVESLKKRIRQVLKKKYGFWDDSRISVKLVHNPHEGRCEVGGNSITNQLRHL